MSAIAVAQFYEMLSPAERRKADALLDAIREPAPPVSDAQASFDYYTNNITAMKAMLLKLEEERKQKRPNAG
ncbi:hypothetical protein [Nonlabens xiamenensis]|uniref:hypothetical protein n=1 Tax=Nonlabens xiamenensis TaxID=2341043 RepID=UPI000F610B65|nr:hypothetical protein [Nonlabens xiamenensis]